MADINPFTQIEEESQAVNPFEEIEGRGEFTPDTLDEINRLNENPGNREFMFVPGRNVNVDLPKGGISRTWELMRRSFNVGDKTTQLGTLASEVIFGDKSPETEEKIKKLQKSLEGPDPVIGVLPPPQEGWVNYIATAISEQVPNLIGMAHDGLEGAVAAGSTTMAATALAGPAAPAVAPLVPISFGGGFATGSLNYAFNQIAGSSYLEYRDFTDKEGNKLPDDMAKLGAVMSGVIGTGLEALPFGLLVKIMPGASKIFQKAGVRATEALKFPTTTQAMKTFLFNIAKVAAAEGITESLQEVVQIETGEALKVFSKGQFDPVTTGDMWARIQEAGLKGAIVGGGISIPVAGARAVSDVAQSKADTKALERGVKAAEEEAQVSVEEKTAEPTEIKPEVVAEVLKGIETIAKEPETKGTSEEVSASQSETIAKIEEALSPIGPSQKTRETLLKGRLDKLDADILNIDNQIDGIEKEIVQKKLSKKPTKALENKTNKLLNQREKLDAERENVIRVALANDLSVGKRSDKTIGTFQALLNKEVLRDADIDASKDILIKGEKIVKLEERSLKDQASALAKGLREGAKLAKKDIKQAIKNTKQLIRATSLPKDTKDAIIAQFVTGEQDFVKNIPKLKSKIATEFERLAVKEQKARIDKSLSRKALKPKVVSGVKQGKFDAEAQVVLENLSELNKVSGKVNPDTGESAASELLDSRISDEINDPLGNAILNMKANPRDVTSREVRAIANNIEILLSDGREASKARVLSKQVAVDNAAIQINDHVTGGKNIQAWQRTGTKGAFRKASQWVQQAVSRLVDGWDEVVDRIVPGSQASIFEIGIEIQKEKGIKRRMSNKLVAAAAKAFGVKEGRKLQDLLESSNEIVDHGLFTNTAGKEVRLELSVSQARKLFMEWQDTTLRETLTSETGNAFTDEMLTFIFNSVLGEQDKVFAQEQLAIYAEFYNEINEVYRRVFGINLDKNEFYSPIRREVDGQEIGLDEFGTDIRYRAKVATNPSLKARQKSIQPIMQRSDIAVFNQHITAMSRFIALREKTQFLNSVFGKVEVRRNLEARYGKDFNLFVGEHLESFVNGANRASDILSKSINFFNRNFAAAQLGAKAKIGFTQTVSYFAYAEFVPAKEFVSGTRDFFLNMPAAIKTLSASELLKDRGFSQDVEIARLGKTFDNAFIKRIQKKQDKMIDYMLIATKIGDRLPIFVGGWSVYKHVLKKTGSKVKAMQAFERATAKTQQSTDQDQLSLAQKTNPLMRGLTMFMSAPIAQFRGEARAVRQLLKGESSPRQFAKSILIYHFILPGLYQALSNGLIFGEWDKDDQIRAAILGSFNGIPIMGDIMNSTIRTLQGKGSRGTEVLKWTKPIVEMIGDLFEAMEAGKEGDFEELTESIYDSFKNSGSITGLPSPQIDNIQKGFRDLSNGDLKAATLRFLGWPSSVVDNIE